MRSKSFIPTAWRAASWARATCSRSVEKAQQEFDQDEMLRQEERLKKGEFTLDDFRKQLSQIGKLGPLQKVMGLIPGMGQHVGDDGGRRSRNRT